MIYENILPAVFLDRPNRFIAMWNWVARPRSAM